MTDSDHDSDAPKQFQIPPEFLEDPAVYVNVCIPVLTPDHIIKLTFGETIGGGTLEWRGSYALTPERAFTLAQNLMYLIEASSTARRASEEVRKGMN